MAHRLVRMLAVLVVAAPVLFALPGPAAAAPVGLQREVGEHSATNSVDGKSSVATCPAGTRVVGTGVQLVGGQGQVVIDDVVPDLTLSRVTVTGREDDDGFSGNWSITAVAICAQAPALLERISFTVGPYSTPDYKTVQGECPGTQVIGLGFEITGASGQVTIEALNHAPILSAIEDEDGTSASWSLTLHLICGRAVPGQHAVQNPTDFDSRNKDATVSCGTQRVISTGAGLTQGAGQVVITEILPNAALTSVRVNAEEDQDGQTAVWNLRPWALCAP